VNELALFAGAGGGILGGKLLGWNTVCAVEYDAYAASVLVARQNDGCLEPFPIWDDVRTFDGKPWRGIVDVVSGGFPCTDISAAGKGAGITGKQSGLWTEMARIVGEVRPRFVFVENSPLLVKRGLAVVLSDLAEMGYDARWGIVGAHHVGAPRRRDRIWLLAYATEKPASGQNMHGVSQEPSPQNWLPRESGGGDCAERIWGRVHGTNIPRISNGVADFVDRIGCCGNGQVPAVAALAWRLLGGPAAHNTTQ
jgi:DNA (cytosine-5)-methyltransferase 1